MEKRYIQITESCSLNLSFQVINKQHPQKNQDNTTQSAILPAERITPNLKRETAELYLQEALAYGDEQKWQEAINACQHVVRSPVSRINTLASNPIAFGKGVRCLDDVIVVGGNAIILG